MSDEQEHAAASPEEFHVVGVGASAGGLESLERLFSHLPPTTGMAFVVLQHLSPDFKSLMDELLARRTAMPVRLAEHEMPVEPDSVYLLPPMKEMVIRDRRLVLSDRDPRHGLAMPIDHFFRSLAHDLGERAIAVVLSGSGSDGSRGIKDVQAGGRRRVLREPRHGAVQRHAAERAWRRARWTRCSHRTRSPTRSRGSDGPARCRSRRRGTTGPATTRMPASTAVLRLLRDEYGIDFSHYKMTTVTRRIERRLTLNRSVDLATYLDSCGRSRASSIRSTKIC